MSNPFAVPPTQNQPAKRKKWPWIVGVITGVVLVAGIAGATGGKKPVNSSSSAATSNTPTTSASPTFDAASSSSAQAELEKRSSEQAAASASSSIQASREAAAEAKAQAEADRKNRQITYEVTTTGPGILSVTYVKPAFQIAQDTAVTGKKWSKTVEADGSTIGLNMNAQNKGGGTISCKISRGGKVVAENSSAGDYAVVSCAL